MTTAVTIRNAQPFDIPYLSEMVQASWTDAFAFSMSVQEASDFLAEKFTIAWFADALRSDVFLVAEIDKTPVGCLQISDVKFNIEQDTSTAKAINTLYIDVDYQRRGIGKQLVKTALDMDILKSASAIYLDVWEDNVKAVSLYKSFGFQKISTIPFIADGKIIGEDIIMKRDN